MKKRNMFLNKSKTENVSIKFLWHSTMDICLFIKYKWKSYGCQMQFFQVSNIVNYLQKVMFLTKQTYLRRRRNDEGSWKPPNGIQHKCKEQKKYYMKNIKNW